MIVCRPLYSLRLAGWGVAVIFTGQVEVKMRRAVRAILLAGIFGLISMASQAAMNPFGPSGLPLTKADYQAIAAATQPLLTDDSLALGTARDWDNPKSGNKGSVKLLERFETKYQGSSLPCRKLQYSVIAKGQADAYNLVLNRCKVADGSWKIL